MKSIGIFAVLMVILSSILLPAPGINVMAQIGDEKRVENMISIAEKAKVRVESLIKSVEGNETLMSMISKAGLDGDFSGNKTLFNDGVRLLEQAKSLFSGGNYTSALNYTIRALELFRNVFRNIHVIVCRAGGCIEKEDVLKAEGLIVAINRSLERIKRIRETESLPSEVEGILSQAEKYLDLTEARRLLSEGNVSAVAHRLAEAEKLISQAFSMLKSEAEKKISERIDKFIVKFNETFEKIIDKAKSLGVNVSKVLSMLNLSSVNDIYAMRDNFVGHVKNYIKLGQFKRAVDELNSAMEKIENMNREMEKSKWQYKFNFKVGIEVNVEKSVKKPFTILDITISNTGNATIIFPNSMYGLTIERKVDGDWKPFYTPISALVLTELKPGQTRHLTIKLTLESGVYRVVVHGMCEKTFEPVTASVEFTIP